MSEFFSEVFTKDNLFHVLVAVGVVGVVYIANIWLATPWLLIVAAIIATVGLYVRELLQVKDKHDVWSFTLLGSLHKNLEWAVGSFVAWVLAIVLLLLA